MKSQKSFEGDGGALYLVPTPIGNLEDMTFRAIQVLQDVDLIAAEDTRNTIKLLNHFEIHTKMVSYHQHSDLKRQSEITNQIADGMKIALVSDAGMPSISDPGHELVLACLKEELPVIPLPGANAALTALIASGLTPQPFYFYGFLPRQNKERREALTELKNRRETWILYESPHRLKETLKALAKNIGDSRKITLCRELTKRYEEFLRGTIAEALSWAENENVRGEFCLIVEGNENPLTEKSAWWTDFTIKEHVEKVMEQDEATSKEAIKKVMQDRGLPKREVYQAYHELKEKS
ncbi:16S rRNA (cytidine(1402)-2'-O)-methyltransferase [Listeria fleischmannii]|uniref:Ribosomal RNA small subunit methyltransferase I n=1 Tax=Listeria fleischmannii TaxID=1069827 RepID=A0A841YFX1_9LIST|nr:16S rRNA (cytidine(1402)-2'-O)-methyltransferase [Listeria fleischmannii]MBC1399008.1 16S rRNA (cytidine(1402)-2'-O)-methyltransferase [Listeria fleischmannii]MBC1427261.1 16S rRNA (cytidine(1402)-2'-O)-methyltransferase [Listeria fleischmannii]STY34655.1 Ribosomal RNA small subunit methyltransferase I [Listeria fleischmannii subsp. coloradonensis]